MPVSLRSSQARQSTSTKVHNAAGAEDQISDHFDSEVDLSDCNLSPDDSLSNLSMSPKLSVTNALYDHELNFARILEAGPTTQRPIDMPDVISCLARPRDDLTLDPTEWGDYSKAVAQAANEKEMVLSWVPQLLNFKALNRSTRFLVVSERPWCFQPIFSKTLGQPLPDVTFGLLSHPLRETYRLVYEDQELSIHLEPLKDVTLPVHFIEFKGPQGRLSDAQLQNRYNGACGIRDVIAIKRAAGRAAKTYVGRVLSLSTAVDAGSVQVHCHWMTITPDGIDRYWSLDLHQPISVYNGPEVQRLVRNTLDWIGKLSEEFISDLAFLEKKMRAKLEEVRLEDEKQIRESGKRARSPSEGVEVPGKPGKKKRLGM